MKYLLAFLFIASPAMAATSTVVCAIAFDNPTPAVETVEQGERVVIYE